MWFGGTTPSRDPPKWTPKKQFFELLTFRCQVFLILVDILETNILTCFGGTTQLGDPQESIFDWLKLGH